MRSTLLATTILALTSAAAAAQTISPGSGSLTDAAGNVWTITQSGSIMEGNQYTPGGGGTAALTIANDTVYGEDDGSGPVNPGGWFALSGNGQSWAPSASPDASTAGPVLSTPAAGTSSQTAGTSTVPAVAPVTVCAALPGGAASGGFTTANGQIIAPDGSVFIAKGINTMEEQVPSATLKSAFPGINFVRYAVYDYASAASLAGYVSDLTAAGIVIELENHNNGAGNAGGSQGTVFTGSALAQEQAWYSDIAAAFKANPYVWFGTNNEPTEVPSAAALSAWQGQTYQTIRGAGNNSPIMVEMNCWSNPVMTCGQGYTASVYAGMTNIVWDPHYYGWLSNYSTDQATVSQNLAQEIAATQQFAGAGGTVPVLIGEYGNSTTGQAIDPNGSQVLTAVQSSGAGSAAWAWGPGNPGDGLTTGGNGLSAYGQEVAGYIALVANASASIWAPNCGGAPVTVASADTPSTATTDSSAQTTGPVAASAAAVAAADAQATSSMAATQQQLDALQPQIDSTNARIQALQAQIAASAAAGK
jgi:hypothetical protein